MPPGWDPRHIGQDESVARAAEQQRFLRERIEKYACLGPLRFQPSAMRRRWGTWKDRRWESVVAPAYATSPAAWPEAHAHWKL